MTVPHSRFTFGLQRVLDLRAQHEQSVAGRLGTAAEAAAEARGAMDALAAVRRASGSDLQRAHGNAMTVGALHQQERVLASMDARIDVAAAEVVEREKVVDEVRGELNVAMQARRVISRLRERREEEWRQAHTRSDRNAMDALALERHGRNTDTESPEGTA